MVASQNNDAPKELSDIKRKLVWRMGVAGLMIVGLLGGLALFDYMSSRVQNEPVAVQYTEPVPVPKKTLTQPVTPIESVAAVKTEQREAVPEASAPPVDKAAPRMDVPQRPEFAAQPSLPKTAQFGSRTVISSPVPSGAAKPAETRATPIPASSRVAETAPVTTHLPAPARLFSGFALQAGVFSDPRRAEELHARLTLEGIPSTIESRVQVGPFKSREEAEAARVKLKSMGLEAVVLPPAKAARR